VVEDFVRLRDWKYSFGADGKAIRRLVSVRRKNIVGLGKEANRIEDGKVLGLAATRGRAKRYVDPDPYAGSATRSRRGWGCRGGPYSIDVEESKHPRARA
jgi:hypothetical protein